MKVPTSVNEEEIKEFFNEAKAGITRVNLPPAHANRPQRIAYVEFGDEEAMKEGLSKHSEKLKDYSPHVVIAEDRETRGSGSFRGGRGRGGGFAHRAVAAAGLVRKRENNEGGGDGGAKD